ncbi:hypothetical protein AB0F17_61825 [Nonomuraea sp. NPDC026600]|uniref:hypothetical protein n=1 Tax=Nonomuraea sp. NPDC026600 TaxID=3155363 RepID=UPI0034060C75
MAGKIPWGRRLVELNCVDHTPRDKNGQAIIKNGKYVFGHVSYDRIWNLGGTVEATNKIISVKKPSPVESSGLLTGRLRLAATTALRHPTTPGRGQRRLSI